MYAECQTDRGKIQRRKSKMAWSQSLFIFLLSLVVSCNQAISNDGYGVIKVNYKFAGSDPTLSALRAHDVDRHLAILSGVDLPLGGTGRPDSVG